MKIGASGIVQNGTGIGVLQRELYPRLTAAGLALETSKNRDLGKGMKDRLRGMLRGFTPARGRHDAYLSAVPPFPFFVRSPAVTIVHDLRWQNTRGALSRAYRKWDLARSVARSRSLVCISARTHADLVSMFPAAQERASVAWLGPGLARRDEDTTLVEREPGVALLVGGAPHKRNELAAQVLADPSVTRVKHVIGVGVSDEVRATLEECDQLTAEWHYGISDDHMRDLYARAEYFVLLSRSEGFGLPYIEALSSGCVVIAADQPLTQELLGDAAILCEGMDVAQLVDEIESATVPALATRTSVSERYSWQHFAARIESELRATSPLARPSRSAT